MFAKLIAGVKYLLTVDQTNSRFVFLLHGIAVAFGTLLLVIAFCYGHGDKAGYPVMIAALTGGGGLVASAGRFLTKFGDAKNAQAAQSAAQPNVSSGS